MTGTVDFGRPQRTVRSGGFSERFDTRSAIVGALLVVALAVGVVARHPPAPPRGGRAAQ